MKFLVFDTETTGLPKHRSAKPEVQPKVIEFGAALLDLEGNTLRTLQLLINPQEPLEAIITKITGLTDEDLIDEPLFEEVYCDIRDIFGEADVMIAHNLPFDTTLIELELERLGVKNFPWPQIKICTVQENVPFWGRRPKMTELFKHVTGEPLAQTHRALDDVMGLVEIIKQQGILHVCNAAVKGTL